MLRTRIVGAMALAFLALALPGALADWNPPAQVSMQEIVAASNEVLGRPDIPFKAREDIFRIRALEMDWDMGAMVYEPEDLSKIPTGPEGNKIGVFLIHGGSSDHRSMDKIARLLVGKFGYKVVSMTFPGRLYLLDPSRDWPGDTIHPDGTVRTPIWNKDQLITPDQYEIQYDGSMREKYGTFTLACAKEGTEFYHRMAGWPVAFEEGGKDLMRRHFPVGEYSIYIHGHSTGGPFSFMFTQRVSNIVGVIGMENSPFGYIFRKQYGYGWDNPKIADGAEANKPFNCLHIRTWRDVARYAGPEALAKEGPDALMRLPMLMEEVFESWKRGTKSPQFKAEGMIHFAGVEPLTAAAQATGKRLNMTVGEAQALVDRYTGYGRELVGKGVKPVPPVIFGVAKTSVDHSPEKYKKITLPMYAAMDPQPKVRLVEFDAGTHGYTSPEPGLPMGPAPAAAKLWYDAIRGGYYEDYARQWAVKK
ncbi:MAG: hypothetical protein HY652_14530 [Acidobacteria bacterium]|nr:hypothetical protein [Acidobacteriota bacterium]